MKTRFAMAAVAAVLLGPAGPARAGAADAAACHAAPAPNCLLSIANDTARRIGEPAPRVKALTVIAGAEAAAGHAGRAAATIAEARRIADGLLPDAEAHAALYDEIVDAQARMGASRAALADTAGAGESAETRAKLFVSAAGALIDFERLDDARALLDRAAAETETAGSPKGRAEAARSVARSKARMGDAAGAVAFLERAGIDAWDHAGALVEIGGMQNYDGDRAGATATLDLAERKAADIEGAESRQTMLTMISQRRPREKEAAEPPPAASYGGGCLANLSLEGLAVSKAELGEFNAAVKIARSLENPRNRDAALAGVAREQAYGGDPDGALETARMIENRKLWANAFETIAFVQAQRGNAEGAWAATRDIEDDETRDRALERNAMVLATAGNPSGAASAAGRISDTAIRATAYATIAWEMADPTPAAGGGAE